LDAGIVHRALSLPALEKDGWKIDAISALHEDCSKELLVEIFKKALDIMRERFDRSPIQHGMYESIHS